MESHHLSASAGANSIDAIFILRASATAASTVVHIDPRVDTPHSLAVDFSFPARHADTALAALGSPAGVVATSAVSCTGIGIQAAVSTKRGPGAARPAHSRLTDFPCAALRAATAAVSPRGLRIAAPVPLTVDVPHGARHARAFVTTLRGKAGVVTAATMLMIVQGINALPDTAEPGLAGSACIALWLAKAIKTILAEGTFLRDLARGFSQTEIVDAALRKGAVRVELALGFRG